MAHGSGSDGVPLISLVVPVHGVAAYLPAFLTSLGDALDAQRSGTVTEVVFVDDGSPDDSAELIERWLADGRQLRGQLVRQPNAGPAAARNTGLAAATGEWVTFPDPDDVLDPGYLADLAGYLTDARNADEVARVHLVVTRPLLLDDRTGEVVDNHPLRNRFHDGTRLVDLGRHPYTIHVPVNTGLFRRAVIEAFGLRFDPRVRPVWEDGHFTARYLAGFERPHLALRAGARYLYRWRESGASLMQRQWTERDKFVTVPRAGWLDALRYAAERHGGRAPAWIQNMVLYDLMGYFKQERRSPSPTATTPPEWSAEFFAVLDEVMALVDADVLEAFRVNYVQPEIRQALVWAYKGAPAVPSEVALDQLDEDRGIVRLHWYYGGDTLAEPPTERFTGRGWAIEPVYAATRPATFYGRTLLTERVVWLPSNGTITAELAGRAVGLRPGPLGTRALHLSPPAIWTQLTHRPLAERPQPRRPGRRAAAVRARRELLRRRDRHRDGARREAAATQRAARTPWARLRFRRAWLLMDRDTQAQDNAEHLYRWLRRHRPRVNAFFVLARSSPDWARLAAEGFRLIEFGSREHRVALLHCEHLVSSQIDTYVTRPLDPERYGPPRWHYTFLQHGVTKDDLSIWINPKPIDLMITATTAEQQAIVADDSPYLWSTREIRLTGFPRHDRLLRLARTARPELVLVMPTWRRSLLSDGGRTGNDRALRDDFWDTPYAVQWRAVLDSEALHAAAAAAGCEIAFVPHPNLAGYLDDLGADPLPGAVRVHRFDRIDVQQLLARAAVLVTDYSSLAFEAAYVQRPVAYFQFDRDEFWNGLHAYRQGSWSYDDDGFGPVSTTADATVDAVVRILAEGVEARFAARMAETFPFRDGRCCERTHDAIREITQYLPQSQLYRRTESAATLAGRPVADELAGSDDAVRPTDGARPTPTARKRA